MARGQQLRASRVPTQLPMPTGAQGTPIAQRHWGERDPTAHAHRGGRGSTDHAPTGAKGA
jgi:hypothetical protein